MSTIVLQMSCAWYFCVCLYVANGGHETAKTDEPIEMPFVLLQAQGTMSYVDRARVPHKKEHRHVPDTRKSQRAVCSYRCIAWSLCNADWPMSHYILLREKSIPFDAACSQITMSILL